MKIVKIGLILLIIWAFNSPSKGFQLEYKFNVGDEYACLQTTRQSVKQNILGIEQITETAMTGSLQLKVVDITVNGAKLEAQYKTLIMLMKLPDIPSLSYDAEGSLDKTENKVMKAMMNKPFFITLTKQGVVENIEGEENLWSGFVELGLDANQLSTIKKQFEEIFGKASIKSSFEMALVNYPNKKIKIGDSWKSKTGLGINLPLEVDNTWNFLSEDKDVINLTADGIITTLNKDHITKNPNGVESKIDLGGTQKLTSTINVHTGWPAEIKITSEIKGIMTLHTESIPTDLEVPMEIKTESNYKFVKK